MECLKYPPCIKIEKYKSLSEHNCLNPTTAQIIFIPTLDLELDSTLLELVGLEYTLLLYHQNTVHTYNYNTH